MQPRASSANSAALPLAAALTWLALAPGAALGAQLSGPARPGATPHSGSNAAPVELAAPKSAFVMPKTPLDGKDPFFPGSSYPYASNVLLSTNRAETPRTVELRLQGISGTAEHRLAIINNRTFEAGEETDVPTQPGRAHIRCLEIKAESVIVQIGSERRELRLRTGF
jgi:hypothetical protein